MLESVHDILIRNIILAGEIKEYLPSEIESIESSASNECRYCKSQQCNNYGYLDCMICKYFVATLSRIPYFEEQIKTIYIKIKNAVLLHTKEDFVNIKLLLIPCLKELLVLK